MRKIEVLGPGCANCVRLAANVRRALDMSGIDAEIAKVTDYHKIVGYGVMSTPGLVIDGKVVSYGRVPDAGEITEMLSRA